MSILMELEMLPAENSQEQGYVACCDFTCGVSCSVTG